MSVLVSVPFCSESANWPSSPKFGSPLFFMTASWHVHIDPREYPFSSPFWPYCRWFSMKQYSWCFWQQQIFDWSTLARSSSWSGQITTCLSIILVLTILMGCVYFGKSRPLCLCTYSPPVFWISRQIEETGNCSLSLKESGKRQSENLWFVLENSGKNRGWALAVKKEGAGISENGLLWSVRKTDTIIFPNIFRKWIP